MWEVLDTGVGSAEANMATDAALLSQIGRRTTPLIHFYDWASDAATHGYFIDPKEHLDVAAAQEQGIELARRPTGGGIVFHIWDFAFSCLVPAGSPHFSKNTLDNYALVNNAVLGAVSDFLGEKFELTFEDGPRQGSVSARFCMARPTRYDVVAGGRKVAGAAQRQTRLGFLHQGTISLKMPDFALLSRLLPHAPDVRLAMQTFTRPLLDKDATKKDEIDSKEELKNLLIKHLSDHE